MRKIEADVAIIGGGIVGLSIAREMRKRNRKVVVLERGGMGEEASGLNGGGVRQQGRLLPEIPLFERYGNNMISEKRVQPWPADDDPIYKNSPYADGIVTILMLTGKLQPT